MLKRGKQNKLFLLPFAGERILYKKMIITGMILQLPQKDLSFFSGCEKVEG